MEPIGGIKLFQMNDSEVYAAGTELQATECMQEMMCCKSLHELRADYLVDGPVTELADEDLSRKITLDEDGPNLDETRTLTFREHLQELVDEHHDFPTFFSTTEY